jgi:ribosomal protein S18 acetylase RimI-like enzyme
VPDFTLRAVQRGDRNWISQFIVERWGSEIVVVHNAVYTPEDLPGIVAVRKESPVGLITYNIEGKACEIVTLDSLSPSKGIGTSLIDELKKVARNAGCRRLWLMTTNDNMDALRFYQKRGFSLAAIHINAVEKARKIKPEIPSIGQEGIPIRDELELELILDE